MYRMGIGIVFTMYCSFDFFSFQIIQTSVNTDVLGRSQEVRVNEVLLYLWCCRDEKVPARGHTVHLMSVKLHQSAANPQTKSSNLGCESICTVGCYHLHSPLPFIITQTKN